MSERRQAFWLALSRESTVIGTAGEAIQRLALPEAEKAALINNIPVAYAVTYLVGTAALVWFLPTIGPKLMGINLREEAARMRSQGFGASDSGEGLTSAARPFDVRAYRVTNKNLINKTIAQLEVLPEDARVFILRVRSGDRISKSGPDVLVREGDVIAVIGRLEIHATRGNTIGPEVSDPALLDIPITSLDVVITNRAVEGKSLNELARLQYARSVFLVETHPFRDRSADYAGKPYRPG